MNASCWSCVPALALLAATSAFSADKSQISPANDISPLEQHPECMERSEKAQSSKCVIQDGKPRRRHPPAGSVKPKPAIAPAKTQPKGQ